MNTKELASFLRRALATGEWMPAIMALRSHNWANLSSSNDNPDQFQPFSIDQLREIGQAQSIADSLHQLGAELWSMDGYEITALDVFRLGAAHGSSDSTRALGDALSWLGMRAEARPWLERAITEPREDRWWYEGLLGALLWEEPTERSRAIFLLEQASQIDMQFGVALARALRIEGRIAESRRILEDLMERKIYGAALQLGNLLADEFGDVAGAELAYLSGISAGDANSAYNLGVLRAEQGREQEADRLFALAAQMGGAPPTT